MFCPECKSEYRQGFTHCPGCDVDLVEQVPPEAPPENELPVNENFTTVFVSLNSSQAELIKGLLEANDLDPVLLDDNLSRIDSPMAIIIGGVKVAVPHEEASTARQILEDYESGAVAVSTMDPGSDEYRCKKCLALLEPEFMFCPKCGTQQFE